MSEAVEKPEQSLWWVGVILVLIGAIGQNLGNNIVSVAHAQTQEENSEGSSIKSTNVSNAKAKMTQDVEMAALVLQGDKDRESSVNVDVVNAIADGEGKQDEDEVEEPYVKKHLWGIGTTIFVVSSCMCFISFGFAAQSLLASLESVQFVSNIAFAKIVHKEAITSSMIISTILIVVGNALVVIFSGHNSLLLNGVQIFELYEKNTGFHVYLCIGFVFMVACEYTWKHYHYCRMKLRQKLWNHSFVEPMCFCASSAIIGAFAVVNAKNISMLLNSSASSERSEFEHAQLYIIFFIWIFIVLFWVGRIDLGLEYFPPLFVIPVIQVCFVFFSILCGGIFFEEFKAFKTREYVGFCSGVLLILFGVYGLAPDSELDFSGDGTLDESTVTETDDKEEIVSQKRMPASSRSRRLSFSGSIKLPSNDATSASNSPATSPSSRKRSGSIAHPLAALKELTRVTAAKAEEAPSLAPVVRATRRLSSMAKPILGDYGNYEQSIKYSSPISDDDNTINEGDEEMAD